MAMTVETWHCIVEIFSWKCRYWRFRLQRTMGSWPIRQIHFCRLYKENVGADTLPKYHCHSGRPHFVSSRICDIYFSIWRWCRSKPVLSWVSERKDLQNPVFCSSSGNWSKFRHSTSQSKTSQQPIQVLQRLNDWLTIYRQLRQAKLARQAR